MKLMTKELGYRRFMAAGGDLGAQVGMFLGRLFPEAIAAIHVTEVRFPTGQGGHRGPDARGAAIRGVLPAVVGRERGIQRAATHQAADARLHLTDSPVGLAAWIVEKLYSWSGHKTDAFTRDELLTNIMIYRVTGTANSAGRMYAENARDTYAQPGGPDHWRG
jgi:microsomal epoxide hydrolase